MHCELFLYSFHLLLHFQPQTFCRGGHLQSKALNYFKCYGIILLTNENLKFMKKVTPCLQPARVCFKNSD